MGANDVRVVAIELQQNVTTLKTAVDALKTAVDAVDAVTSTWVVNSDDGSLPTDLAVKAELANFNALSTTVVKPANSLNDSIAIIEAAE